MLSDTNHTSKDKKASENINEYELVETHGHPYPDVEAPHNPHTQPKQDIKDYELMQCLDYVPVNCGKNQEDYTNLKVESSSESIAGLVKVQNDGKTINQDGEIYEEVSPNQD